LSRVKTQRAQSTKSSSSKYAPSEIEFKKGIISKINQYNKREDKAKHPAVNVLLGSLKNI
jgi:hypothetical protein